MMIRLLLILVLVAAASADDEDPSLTKTISDLFSAFTGKDEADEAVPEKPEVKASSDDDHKAWVKRVYDLAILTRTALIQMGDIAYKDNPHVGVKIKEKLNDQIATANLIYTEFKDKGASKSRRRRDAAACNSAGAKALNGVAQVLTESNDKTQPEKSQLSGGAQGGMDKVHDKAVDDCDAEFCKVAQEKRRFAREAKAGKAAAAANAG